MVAPTFGDDDVVGPNKTTRQDPRRRDVRYRVAASRPTSFVLLSSSRPGLPDLLVPERVPEDRPNVITRISHASSRSVDPSDELIRDLDLQFSRTVSDCPCFTPSTCGYMYVYKKFAMDRYIGYSYAPTQPIN